MKIILFIGAGSFIGGVLRYLISVGMQSKFLSAFPIGTLTVNIIGCFLIGILFGVTEKLDFTTEWRLFLITGILGGFTTFSAFSLETIGLLSNGLIGQAIGYVLLSVFIGLLATLAGMTLFKFF
ncbi:MAG: fluoride efflux transporter CrcB [Balneolales bacterium]|nr:fluoride efflux transporter CrcB [Balneolales bacterium]